MVVFARLLEPIERKKIKLISSPFWVKIGPCPPGCDQKDMLHAVGQTFGRVLRSEVKREFCRMKVNLDVQRPLRRGGFISVDGWDKKWIAFKYENLPTFCFECGKMGHSVQSCEKLPVQEKEKPMENFQFTNALREESSLFGREAFKLGFSSKKSMKECFYIRLDDLGEGADAGLEGDSPVTGATGEDQLTDADSSLPEFNGSNEKRDFWNVVSKNHVVQDMGIEQVMEMDDNLVGIKSNDSQGIVKDTVDTPKVANWKRKVRTCGEKAGMILKTNFKRKHDMVDSGISDVSLTVDRSQKKMKQDSDVTLKSSLVDVELAMLECIDAPLTIGSVAAERQVDRS